MTDINSRFSAVLTRVGAIKQANANALGRPWRLTELGVGDANGTEPTPDPAQLTLINERRRAAVNLLRRDSNNEPVIVAEQILPADVGGWWIRELGLYDEDGDLVAVANCPPSYKPLLSQGAGRTQNVRMNVIVSSTGTIELKIDPSVVLATREYVEQFIKNYLPGELLQYAPINSPLLTGDPRGPTPAQFDNDTSLATTSFVRSAMGNLSGYVRFNTNTVIPALHVGKWLSIGPGVSPSLPNPATLPDGVAFHVCLEGNYAGLRVSGATSVLVEGTALPAPVTFEVRTYALAVIRDRTWELIGLGRRLVT